MILSIDPGNIESAYTFIADNLKPISFGKVDNTEMLRIIDFYDFDEFVIEGVASYGMAVGKEVFDTCIWIGRFWETARNTNCRHMQMIYRKEVKMNLCNNMRAKDTNIRQALIDRFGVVGTKKNPGWFYGFKSDIWSAYSVGVTYHDMYLKGVNES